MLSYGQRARMLHLGRWGLWGCSCNRICIGKFSIIQPHDMQLPDISKLNNLPDLLFRQAADDCLLTDRAARCVWTNRCSCGPPQSAEGNLQHFCDGASHKCQAHIRTQWP